MKIIQNLSPNYSKGTMAKTIVILHFTLAREKSVINEFLNPSTKKSAHAVFPEDGRIIEMVHVKNDAWASGNISNPSVLLKKNIDGKYINPNKYSIQLEICAGYDRDHDGVVGSKEFNMTRKQLRSIIFYLRKLEKNNEVDIVLIPENILTHKDIASYKPDLERARNRILRELTMLRELKRDVQTGAFYFIKDGSKQKVDSVNGLLTVISREFGVENMSTDELNQFPDKKFF